MAMIAALQQANSIRGPSLAEAFKADDITTVAMNEAIRAWFDLYFFRTPTKGEDPAQRIPYVVINKLTRTVFSEYEATSQSAFATSVLEALDDVRKKAMQQGLVGGEALLKPVFDGEAVRFSVIDRQAYLVFGRDDAGKLTDIGTTATTATGGYFYTLLERRSVDERGYLTVENQLRRSQDKGALGVPVPLSTLPKYADLQDIVTYPVPVGSVGLIPIRTPMVNCVDGSPDSVSIYEPAVGLIRNIAINEAQINGEFERGESRIVVSGDMMELDAAGKRAFKDNIFTGLPDGPDEVGVTIFSPAFREQSFFARKNEYLRNIESLIGFKRGILSEVEAAERTATEVTSSAGDYAITITDLQAMWTAAALEALRVCGILGKLYRVPGAMEVPENAVSISYGDGVLYNRDQVNQEMFSQVQAGLLSPERYLGWYYDQAHDTPEERQKIRENYMPDVGELTEEGER